MRFFGLDPGANGGLAVLDNLGIVYHAGKMPDTERELLDLLLDTSDGDFVNLREKHNRAVLEKVHSSPQMGVVSAFTFGKGYGALRMALVAAGIPFDEVSPVKWQGAMGVLQPRIPGVKRAQGSKDKNISKRRASEIFPGVKVTHAIADALLLAEYARRLEVRTT